MKKILVIGFKYGHHQEYSGYDKIVDMLLSNTMHDIEYLNIYRYMIFKKQNSYLRRVLHRINHRAILIYLRYFLRGIQKKNISLVHFLYPEDTIKKIFIPKLPGVKYMATFHMTQNSFNKLKGRHIRNLKQIDGAIILGKTQIEFVRNIVDPSCVHFIPHGVDTTYFCNKNMERSNNELLIVGSWERDFDLMEDIIKYYEVYNPALKFHLVIGSINSKRYFKYSNVVIHNSISNNVLLGLYNKVHAVLFVLKDTVANNAMLESLSTGNCVITNSVGSVESYVSRDEVIFADANLESFVSCIDMSLENVNIQTYRTKAFVQSKKYDWNVLSNELMEVYRTM